MIIKYIGHSCFKILDEETGYSIVFDPYEPGSVKGFGDIKDAASSAHTITSIITIKRRSWSSRRMKARLM